jgi:hypothetical protein
VDPDEYLADILLLANKYPEGMPYDWKRLAQYDEDMSRMCDLIKGLDEWISKGGHLPRRWSLKATDTRQSPGEVQRGRCGMRHHHPSCDCGGVAGDR